ncbi:putative FBD-associated F-box protein At5g56440, partial [Eutrema salsugineum]
HHAIIEDVPLTICFRSLKLLVFIAVDFSSDEIFYRLLSGCTDLQKLAMVIRSYGNVKTFTIAVPSLESLLIMDSKSGSQVPGDDVGIVVNAPSLKLLNISNRFQWVCSLVHMPKLVIANIKLRDGNSKKLLGCLTSARHLSFCLKKPQMDSYPIGVFTQLVSLKICACSSDWFRLILRQTPKLRVLRFQLQVILIPSLQNISERCFSSTGEVQTQWERPSSVPKCLISSLETVEWIDYKGTEAEKKVLMYLLENSRKLKKMAIRPLKSTILEDRYKMLQEVSSMERISSECRLSFS